MSECRCRAEGLDRCPVMGIKVGEVQYRRCETKPEWRGQVAELTKANRRREQVAEAVIRAKPAKAPSRPATARVRTATDLPCVHRGGVLEVVGCVPCRSRGQDSAAVYKCGIHGRCMIENFSTRKPGDNAVACSTCDDRASPADG